MKRLRNPVLGLPEIHDIRRGLRPQDRVLVENLLMAFRAEAQRKADLSWRRHKAPMAAYWKAVAVYAGHIARALR